MADGEVVGASFSGPVNRIKIVASSVTVATHARVTIQQSLN